MEVELGINITPTNIPPITKDPKDPLFLSTESDTLFILIANLKGYQKEKLKIARDEDGTQIAVSGEKEAAGLLPRRFAFRATAQVTKFRKVFRIPNGVVVDQINARFNNKESLLWVFMPKLVKGVTGVAVEEVKEEEIGRDGNRRTRTVPDKVPERGIPANNELDMKEVRKDLSQYEPEVKEAISKTEVEASENQRKGEEEMKEVRKDLTQREPEVKEAFPKTEVEASENQRKGEEEMKEVRKDLTQREPEVKEAIPETEVAGPENQRKGEEDMKEGEKDVEPTGEVVGELPQPEPEVKEDNERESPTKNEQEMEDGKKDIKADEVGIGARLPQLMPEVGEAAEREDPRKTEQRMEEEKNDMEANDEVVGRLTQHEPQEVKEAADITMPSPEEEPALSNARKVPSEEETPEKEETNLEAKGGAAGEKSEECQHDQNVTESTIVEADQVTQGAHAEEYNAHEENGKAETHPSHQEPNTEIQEASQLIADQGPLSDPTEPQEPDNPEQVQGMDQAETYPVIPPEGKFRLFSPSFFAGSAILVSIAVLVIYFCRSKRR